MKENERTRKFYRNRFGTISNETLESCHGESRFMMLAFTSPSKKEIRNVCLGEGKWRVDVENDIRKRYKTDAVGCLLCD